MLRKALQNTKHLLQQRLSQSAFFMRQLRAKFPIRIAETRAERSAIARFWYQTMIEEQNRAVPFADHTQRTIWTDEDDQPNAVHCYTTDSDGVILGALRVRVWGPGEVPEVEARYYGLDRVEGAKELTLCDIHRFVVKPEARGSLVAVALSSQAILHTVERYGVEAALADCAPGLLHHWRRFGFRPYGARLVCTYHGVTVPLMVLTNDLAHAREVGSPWCAVGVEMTRRGLMPERSLVARYRGLFASDDTVVDCAETIRDELNALASNAGGVLHGLPARVLDAIGRNGVIINVEAGQQLTLTGVVDRDVYIVVSGELKAYQAGRVIGSQARGAVFGEVAMLSSQGQRTSDVVATTPCRLFVLRNRFWCRLERQNPEDAFELYQRLGRLMADRIAQRRACGDEVRVEACFEGLREVA